MNLVPTLLPQIQSISPFPHSSFLTTLIPRNKSLNMKSIILGAYMTTKATYSLSNGKSIILVS